MTFSRDVEKLENEDYIKCSPFQSQGGILLTILTVVPIVAWRACADVASWAYIIAHLPIPAIPALTGCRV